MAHKSESVCKGLSFIDWDDLNEEEYQKLNRIINTPSQCSGVQLPFNAEGEKPFVPLQFEESTAFQSVIPAPPIVGFPIPLHWTHGDPTMCPPTGSHFPITMPGGYVFPNPALTASGETSMAFVAALSSVQTMYPIPGVSGHHIPHYQTAPMPQSEPVDLSLPATRPPVDSSDQIFTYPGDIIAPTSPIHSVPLNHVSQGAANITAVVSQMASMCRQVMTHAHAPQVVYIPQASSVPSMLTSNDSECPAYENSNSCSRAFTSQSHAITGLSLTERPPSIEFGGPVVFSSPPADNNKHLKSNSRACVPVGAVDKEVEIEMEALDISDLVDSQHIEKQDRNTSNDVSNSQPPPIVHTPSSATVSTSDTSSVTPGTSSRIQEQSDSVENKDGVENKDATCKSGSKTTPPAKMWSSLFGNKGSSGAITSAPVVSRPSEVLIAAVPNAVITDEVKSVKYWQEQEKNEAKTAFVCTDKVIPVGVQNDPLAHKILEQLGNLPITHTPIVIQPRGLVNGSNTCFMNASLQVLMGCPPFVHMFRAFRSLPPRPGSCSSTPIFDSLVQFVNSFQNGQRIRHQSSRSKKITHVDINVGQPFSPAPLLSVAQSILGLHIGVQQDAEEFLSRLLMICHEELENVMKLHHADAPRHTQPPNGYQRSNDKVKAARQDADNINGLNNNEREHRNGFPEPVKNEVEDGEDDDDMDDESWLKVGPKNHHVETNVNDCGQTPLSSIFAGLSRSCLIRESGKTSDTVDSFFTLKLDIQAEGVHSVNDALLRLNTTETVHDADGGKVQGQRRMFFDVLPPVLIMHLKLFQYSNGNGQKIQKKIDFDVDLIIPKETLSRAGKIKLASNKARTYKLFGVVNHHGMKMNDGHYTSDVYLPVANGWLHFDDSDVSPIQESQVLQYSERRMPYLLFYRRMDL